MNDRYEWGSVHLSHHNSQKSLPRSRARTPLSPLSRNVGRSTSKCPESSMLRAAKSLDLTTFQASFPREKGPNPRLPPPQHKLRSFRSRAFRADMDQVDIYREEDKLLPPMEDIEHAPTFYSEEDRFQIIDVVAESHVIDSDDSDTEDMEDLSSDSGHDSGHDYEHEENEAELSPRTTLLQSALDIGSSTPAPEKRNYATNAPTPETKRSAGIEIPEEIFAPPPEPAAPSSPRRKVGTDGDSTDVRPASRHRRALSRIATIGEVPPLIKTPDHTPLNSPRVDQMCIFTAAHAHTTDSSHQPAPGLDSLQNILSQLAQKERRVLEAEHALRDAKADLVLFQERLNTMMDPAHGPLTALCGAPQIINRRHQPNIGIYGLHYVQTIRPSPQPTTTPVTSRELSIGRESIAFRLVHSLLGLVHCIISVFPTHRIILPRTPEVVYVWSPDYPSATQIFYGLEL